MNANLKNFLPYCAIRPYRTVREDVEKLPWTPTSVSAVSDVLGSSLPLGFPFTEADALAYSALPTDSGEERELPWCMNYTEGFAQKFRRTPSLR